MSPIRPLLACLLTLSACDAVPPQGALDDPSTTQAPTPITMALTVSPGSAQPGQLLQIDITGAAPGTRVTLGATSRGTGSGPCPSGFGGACLDIRMPAQVVFSATANGAGEVRRSVPLPSIPPATYTFQAITFGGTSNTATLAVQACTPLTWYGDVDGDGFGDDLDTVLSCTQPADYASVGGDCDDGNTAAFPGGTEVLTSGADEDCDGVVDEMTFTQVYTNVLQANCSCHAGSSHPTGFFFNNNRGTAFAKLVSTPSAQSPLDRVEPGDATLSYLMHKLDGTQGTVGGSGSSMPLNLAPSLLSLATRDGVRGWIEAGAPND